MLRSAPATFAIGPAVLVALLAGWLVPLEHALTDLRFRLAERQPTGDIVLVDIDAKSIEAEGRWPWPRRIHAELVDNLRALGASEIAFDVDFSARSNPGDDAAFAAALERAGGMVILAALDQSRTSRPGETALVHNRPIDALARNAWIASLNVDLDRDGKVRRLKFADENDGEVLPTLAAILGGGTGVADRSFAIDFGIGADRIDRMSVVDILGGNVERDRIAGKKVIVGASAVELRDFFRVPVYGSVSGSLLQALGAESIAQDRALIGSGPLVSIAGVLALSLLFFSVRRLRWTYLLALLALSSLTIEVAAFAIQRSWPLVPMTAAWQATLCGFALLTLLREIDFRRILILIAHTRALNTQTILDRVVEDNFAGVIVADQNGVIRAASRSAAEILERRSALVGRQMAACLPAQLCDSMRSALEAARRGVERVTKHQEFRHRRRDGQVALLEYVITPSRLVGGPTHRGDLLPDTFVATLTFVDATEERQAAGRIAALARFDTLTGLPNRNEFLDALDVALRRMHADGTSCAVICFDLDRFKNINDTLGHDIGDLALKAVAGRTRRLLPPGDLVARFGADDFAIVCSGGDAGARACALAESLIANVEEPYDLLGRRQIVAMSFGIAEAEGADRDALALLQRADTALCAAKANGGNRVARFDPSMAAGMYKWQSLESDLWEAFERRDFELYYQPQVDLAEERLTGFEALLRWRHPHLGFISPAEFVPIAEASGLIQRLGAWVLEEACATAASWPESIKLAVNVSPLQFVRGDLVRTVAQALARSGMPARRLELEITESVLLQEKHGIRTTIDELRGIGVNFALDDFGTGYSSLNYIHKFPIAKIKIDRTFVSGMPLSQESAAIVSAVAALARSLNIRLNAEGIETREQVELLRLLGCAEGQGYLFGRPEPAEAAARLIAASPTPLRAVNWA